MLIECKYYDVAAKEMEELDKQIAEESENLSEGELQLENDRRDFQLAEIIRSFKEKEKMKEIVPDPGEDCFVYQTAESFDGTG